MKKAKIAYGLLLATLAGSLAGCCGGDPEEGEIANFDFKVSLKSGKSSLEVGDSDDIVISTNGVDDANKSYTYTLSKSDVVSVYDGDGLSFPVTALAEGSVVVVIKETSTNKKQNLTITVTSSYPAASGGKNFASSAGEEAIAKRTEILGKLEKYAAESHLAGITLFENGGYVKYSSRLEIPTNKYITGYGFGILSEGNINKNLPGDTSEYSRYYHSAQATNPGKINAMDDTGSQVSDLASYITSSYWGTKMTADKTKYEWYPILAKDTINGKKYERPTPIYGASGENRLGLYNKWRVYVKTGEDGVKYRTNGVFSGEWDNKPVSIDDYEFSLKMLLTGANQLVRGAEIAGDKTYGIKGAQTFYNRTTSSDVTQEFVDTIWNNMKASGELGLKTGKEGNDYYIEFDLINEIDEFTAMTVLSSNLYSPLPQDFVKMLGSGEVKKGAKIYGESAEAFNLGSSTRNLTPNDTTLSLGAYYLEKWSEEYIAYKKNTTWFERSNNELKDRYKIEGVKITTYADATSDSEALYKHFYADELDSCGVPTSHIKEEKTSSTTTTAGEPTITLETEGDSTFKLNINSCTQERWDELFGKTGKIYVTDDANKYQCKPWMSNDNFLNGLYWSINRKLFAENRGAKPSINYFSNAYLSDPEKGVSYNSTEAHRKAVERMHNATYDKNGNPIEDDYGYNKDKAISYFTKAYSELRAAGHIIDGTASNPTIITISIKWMYQSDINDYGSEIVKYFTDAFNDPKVCGGKVKLVVEQPNPSTDWQAVYNEVMRKGQFDLAFGAISGNTYNPLNFLEVLRSDNSSTFTLNWGPDTSVIDEKHPIVYQEEKYSFDALWESADHGAVVEGGASVSPIKECYMKNPQSIDGSAGNDLYKGSIITVPLEFISVKDIELDVAKITLFIVNGETHNIPFVYDKASNTITFTIDTETAAAINEEIRTAQKIKDDDSEDKKYPFTRSTYNKMWNFELTYTLSINGGTPVANTVAIPMTKDAQDVK